MESRDTSDEKDLLISRQHESKFVRLVVGEGTRCRGTFLTGERLSPRLPLPGRPRAEDHDRRAESRLFSDWRLLATTGRGDRNRHCWQVSSGPDLMPVYSQLGGAQ